ncbi:MAG: VanW family protein [Ruminococcus sp.]
MRKDSYDDYIVLDEGLVDISSGKAAPTQANDAKHSSGSRKNPNNKNNKKKIIVISSVAAAVVVALGITGFCLFQSGVFGNPAVENGDFVFKDGTVVSGVSISGKTMEEARKLLESGEESFIKPISISVDADGDVTTLTQSDFEYTFNIDTVLSNVKNDTLNPSGNNTSESKTYEITATVTVDSIEKNAKKIEKATNRDAKNAYVSKFTPYSDNRFEYAEAEKGRKLNAEDLTDQLKTAVSQGTAESRIIADVETVDAKINVDDLKKNIIKLSSYETVSTNSENGTENMRVSLAACNGSVIEPGATWSFNKCTGDSNLESNGYKSAGVIANGELTSGIGGGICQSSSTIYNAAIRANMDVEERYCHKWASSYVPTGLDATIDYPRLDLKLSNPTDYQMFMECKLVDRTLYVSIWGAKDSSYDEIKTHNEMTDKGDSSYTVKAWKVYYKDGKEVDRKSLGSSTYDSDHGYVFIEADNDSNAKNTNVDHVNETTKPESSNSESSHSSSGSSNNSSSSSSKPQSSSSSSSKPKPTQAPTEAPTEPPAPPTEPEPVPTDPPETSESN